MPPKMYITLEVDDKGSAVIKSSGKKIKQYTDSGTRNVNGLTSAWGNLGKAVALAGSAFGARVFLQSTYNMAKLGAETRNVQSAFNRLEGSTNLLNRLKDASKNAVPELELMRGALTGIDLGATNQQLVTFLKYARLESVKKGKDTLHTFGEIMSGVLRGSTEMLDNFGIRLAEVNTEVARLSGESGKAATKLSAVENAELKIIASTNIMNRKLAEAGDIALTNAEKISQAAAAWDEFSRAVSKLTDDPVAEVLTGMTTPMNQFTSMLERLEKLEMPWYEKLKVLWSFRGVETNKMQENALWTLSFYENFQKQQDELDKKMYGDKPLLNIYNDPFGPPAPGTDEYNNLTKIPEPTPLTAAQKAAIALRNATTGRVQLAEDQFGTALQQTGFAGLRGYDFTNKDKRSIYERMQEQNKPQLTTMTDDFEDKFEIMFSFGEQRALAMTQAVGNAFWSLGGQINNEFNSLWNNIFNTGDSMFGRLAASFMSGFTTSIVDSFSNWAAGGIMDFILPGAGSLFGFLAEGGPAEAGKPYVVGEKGPELFVPKVNGQVIPNRELLNVASTRINNSPVLQFNDNITATGFLGQDILNILNTTRKVHREEILRIIKDAVKSNRLEL